MKNIKGILSLSFLILLFFCCNTAIAQETKATDTAIFAGGCFWCLEADFDKVDGVLKTTSGYTGGSVANPTYKQVSAGGTGHYEAVKVEYNPDKISYEKLLNVFWHNIDPTDATGQFCDKGNQYRAVIFYKDETQKKLAFKSKEDLLATKRFPIIATEILPEKTFYPAEEYHQKYYKKNPVRYKFYRYQCGRDQLLHELWGAS